MYETNWKRNLKLIRFSLIAVLGKSAPKNLSIVITLVFRCECICICEIRSFSHVADQVQLLKKNQQYAFKHLRSKEVRQFRFHHVTLT